MAANPANRIASNGGVKIKPIITKLWRVTGSGDPDKLQEELKEAAACLRQNEVVGFPTETVYGLGGNALDDNAIDKIFSAKGRPSDNPLIVHVASVSQWEKLVTEVPPVAKALADAFWPGPLTIVLPANKQVSLKCTAGQSTVGVRIPSHPVALALLREANVPIAAPSANVSGKPSPTSAAHVMGDLGGKISGVVDADATCGVGVESTVVDCSCFCGAEEKKEKGKKNHVTILRPGGVTREMLEKMVHERFSSVAVQLDPALAQGDFFDDASEGSKSEKLLPRAPGMKYRHYAPRAELRLVNGSHERLQELVSEAQASGDGAGADAGGKLKRKRGLRVGAMVPEDKVADVRADLVVPCGRVDGDAESFAGALYDSLRAFDRSDVELIFCCTLPDDGIGHAVMNRLMKAANGRVVT